MQTTSYYNVEPQQYNNYQQINQNIEYDYPELVGDSSNIATNWNNFNSNYMQSKVPYDLNLTQTDLDLSFLQDITKYWLASE